jgi:hypothetical protein
VSGRNREPLKTRKGTRVELALRGWWENKVDVLPLETVGFYDINEHLSSRFVPTLEVNGEQVVARKSHSFSNLIDLVSPKAMDAHRHGVSRQISRHRRQI